MVMPKMIVLTVAVGALAFAGQFKHGLGSSDKVTLSIPHPPDALLKAKNLGVQWESTGDSFRRADQVRQMVQQGLAKEFTFADPNPEAVVKLSVLSYEPVTTQTYTQTENRTIKVGEKTVTGKDGKSHQEDVFAARQVPVEYWKAGGSVKMNVGVTDKGGTLLDSFAPAATKQLNVEIAVNGEAKAGRGSLPTSESLETQMLELISHQVQRRYTATFDSVEVMLAVDSELRQGNKLGQTGQWKEAFENWNAGKLKKNPADRVYNMAVAKEAMAYADYSRSQSLEEMLPMFKEAMVLYEEALKGDPQEKYMQKQVQRLTLAKTNIDNVRKQYEDQQEAAKRAAEETRKVLEARTAQDRQKQELDAAVKDVSPDSLEEAKFRPIARARMANVQGDTTEQQTKDLIAFGQRTYGVNELKSTRVVRQEVERKRAVGQKLKDYDETLQALVADGDLTAGERLQLKDLQKTTGLEDPEVQVLEAKYTFKDEEKIAQAATAAAVKTPVKADAPIARKPVTKRTTTTVKPAAAPVPPKPAPAKPGIGGGLPQPKQN